MNPSRTEELATKLRKHVLRMTNVGGSSHVGSAFSIADIVSVLYGEVLKIFPDEPKSDNRDRFILSKGHAGSCVYAALAETGFFSVDLLKKHYQNGSTLSGHISHSGIPGVEFSTGSLGHGLPVAAGMAYAAKLDNKEHYIYTLLSDGECDEGSNWEAILFAAHHRLNNLCVIVDYNKLQSLASVSATLELEPFTDKWEAFGWYVNNVDGHDHDQLRDALYRKSDEFPTVIIAHTVKGKGVSFMENSVLWHYRCAKNEEFSAALEELEKL